MPKKTEKKERGPAKPLVFETFRDIGSWEIGSLQQAEPSCFNGWVRVQKYRVTVEQIEEPLQVIHERLIKLWLESDNSHHIGPLRRKAEGIGLDLSGYNYGSKRKERVV